jgi:hypothetical protein
MIYGELGACPMSVYIQTRIVHFWSKLVNCENIKLSSIIYTNAYLRHTQNGLEMPWIKAVKNILDSCGFSNIWENQGNFNSKWLSLSLRNNGCFKTGVLACPALFLFRKKLLFLSRFIWRANVIIL